MAAIDDPRWRALAARDAEAAFLYSVRTTGVYCRPSCGARRPNAENVAFHPDRVHAEAAGFRPCRRCRPDQPPLAVRRGGAVAAACRTIEAAVAAGVPTPTLSALAASAGFSAHYFQRVFKALTGLTPRAYAAAERARRVRARLEEGAGVTEAIYDAGYSGPGRFYEQSRDALGMSAGAYRRGGAAETIRFAVGPSLLGLVLVARTERGVCAIQFGEAADTLEAELRSRFPRAAVSGPDGELQAELDAVVAAVEAPRRGLDLPLDIRGTAFQQQVWRALSQTPPGRTVSYGELAAAAGRPGAARAAGAACGANPLAVAVPCHRAVGRSGALTGYRWGLHRKQALLDREQARGEDEGGGAA